MCGAIPCISTHGWLCFSCSFTLYSSSHDSSMQYHAAVLSTCSIPPSKHWLCLITCCLGHLTCLYLSILQVGHHATWTRKGHKGSRRNYLRGRLDSDWRVQC